MSGSGSGPIRMKAEEERAARAIGDGGGPLSIVTPSPARADGLLREVRSLDGRDSQLFSIGLLIVLVLAAGFAALVLPNVVWGVKALQVDSRYLPQLFFGFIALIVLFNVYAINQRRMLQSTRDQLVRELIRGEAADKLTMLDPLTEVFNRRYLDHVLGKEVSRADRLGTSLTFLMVDVDGFKSVNARFGHVVGDRILMEVAQLLKKTFRTSDIIVRYGADEFLAILTETNEAQAQSALARLLKQASKWNEANASGGYRMSFSCGLAAYTKGANVNEIIAAADQRLYLHKVRQVAAS